MGARVNTFYIVSSPNSKAALSPSERQINSWAGETQVRIISVSIADVDTCGWGAVVLYEEDN